MNFRLGDLAIEFAGASPDSIARLTNRPPARSREPLVKRLVFLLLLAAVVALGVLLVGKSMRSSGRSGDAEMPSAEAPDPATLPASQVDVFAAPRLIAGGEQGAAVTQLLFAKGQYAEAEAVLSALVRAEPRISTNHYNLACALARQGKTEAALASLRAAVENGFRNVPHIAADPDLVSLRQEPEFLRILEQAKATTLPASLPQVAPATIRNGIATVGTGNTALYSSLGVLYSTFALEATDARKSAEAVKGQGTAGALVRQWQREGHAAGLLGVLYDNRDRDHSTLSPREFPQLNFVEYSAEARREGLDHGLQVRFLFNLPTLGNSSTAQTGSTLWRSQARLAQTTPAALGIQLRQYFGNHLYVYPEHRDYDAGRNGQGGGYGDVFPAHTPYCMITRGSSGSDLPLMRALALTVAAFRPETFERLLQAQMLAPTLQAIVRRCYRPVQAEADYFTDRAHPVAFDVTRLQPEAMVRMAQAMTPDAVPPVVRLAVKEEDGPRPGADYAAATPGEVLFDSACAVARVWQRAARTRRMVLNTESSFDPNERALTYRWVLLQGDPARVAITPLTPNGSVAELRVTWHDRFVVPSEDRIASNRVDIGVFASNGAQWSAPAFVTFFCPDSVARRYDDAGRLTSIEYRSVAQGGNYADPIAFTPRDWRDELHYDASGHLLGWTRSRGSAVEEFTAEGWLTIEKDEHGRPLVAREVRYVADSAGPDGPLLRQIPTTALHRFQYFSAEDRRGRSEPVTTP
jgi:hypothetical protein